MSVLAWLRRPSSPPESSHVGGGHSPSRRHPNASDSLDSSSARGVAASACSVARGLRPVLAAALLSLPLFAGLTTEAAAQTTVQCTAPNADGSYTVPHDWALTPSGLGAGTKFRLLFVTSTARSATATNIATYNTFVQNRAKAGHSAISDSCGNLFKVVGSTATVDARDNTLTTSTSTGARIHWLNGGKLADNYADFYDGTWDSYGRRDESGGSYTPAGSGYTGKTVYTGTRTNGTKAVYSLGHQSGWHYGNPVSGYNPIGQSWTTLTNDLPFYGLSPVFKVDSTIHITIAPGTSPVTEGTNATYTLTATPPVAPGSNLTINYTVADADNADFVASGDQGTGKSVSLGNPFFTRRTVSITVPTATDSNDEPNGPVTVTVNTGAGYTVGSTSTASVTVNDDDATTVTLAGTSAEVTESKDKTFTLTLGRGLRNGESLTVPLTFGGTATRGTDYSTACPNTLPTGVACANLDSGNATVTFTGPASGATATAVTLTLSAAIDSIAETETVIIGLGTLTHAGLGGGATGTDNLPDFNIADPVPPVITISPGNAVTEGTAASFTVSASPAPVSRLTVNLTVADAPGADFVASGDQGSGKTVTINADSSSATYSVPTTRDGNDEPSGPVTVTVNTGTGYEVGSAAEANVRVNDDDATSVTLARVGSGAVTEGDHVEFTVTLGRALIAGEVIGVPLSISGTNVTAGDWSLESGLNTGVTLSGESTATPTVRFSGAGARTETLELTAEADGNESESTETFIVALGPDGGGANGFDRASLGTNVGGGADPHATANSFSVMVNNNNKIFPIVTIAAGNAVTEGAAASFTVSASPAPASRLTVHLTVADAPGADFVASDDQGSGKTVTINAGSSSATYSVPTALDSNDEPSGPVTVTVNSGSDYRVGTSAEARVRVNDNDPTTVTLALGGPAGNISEGGTKTFTVTLGRGLRNGESLTVPLTFRQEALYYLPNGPATRNTDYTTACPSPLPTGVACHDLNEGSNPRVTFIGPSTGATVRTVTLTLSAKKDGTPESGGETVDIGLGTLSSSGLDGGARGTDSLAAFSIIDLGTNAKELSLTNIPPDSNEGDSGESSKDFFVEHTEGTGEVGFTVCVKGTAEKGTDFTWRDELGVTNARCLAALKVNGGAKAKFTLKIIGDTDYEPDETIIVTLGSADAKVGTSTFTYTIKNDDANPPAVTIAPETPSVTEGNAARFRVSASPAPAFRLTVNLTVEDAPGGADFVAPSNQDGNKTVTINAGDSSAIYSVPTTSDSKDERSGPVKVTVNTGTDYRVGTLAEANVRVNDDDAPGAKEPDDEGAKEPNDEGGKEPNDEGGTDTLPAAHPVMKHAAVVERFYDRITADHQHGDSANGGWNKRFLKAMGHPEYVDYPQAAVTVADAERLWNHGGPGANTAWDGTVDAVTYAEQYFAGKTTPPPTADPDPEITIAAGSGVTEGTAATFTVTADRAPDADLSVTLNVAEAQGSDFVAASDEGAKTVTIEAGKTSATLTVATDDDGTDEPDGSVTATVQAGTGYTVGATSSGTVAIADDDEPVTPVVDDTLPAAHPVMKHAAVVKRFYDRLTAGNQHGDGAAGGWNKRFLKAMGHPEYVDYPQAAVTVADATRLWNHGGPGANTAWDGTVDAVTYAEQYFAGTTTPPPTPDPEITIAAGSGVTEGGDATFTLTATPPPAAPLEVTVTVAVEGAFGITAGERTVTIPTSGSFELTLATDDDGTVEPDGSVTATLAAGSGYTVASSPKDAASVAVADNDGLPAVSIHDRTVQEKRGAVTVRITLSEPSTEVVRVTFTTNDARSTATVGEDYLWTRRTVTFSPGETRTLIGVFLLDDSIDDPDETIIVELSNPRGAVIADGEAVITIENSDPLPSAWLTRFGRAAAETAIGGITARMEAPRTPGTEAAVGGYALGDVALGGEGARHQGGLITGGMLTHPGIVGGERPGGRSAGQFPGGAGLLHTDAPFQAVNGPGFGAGPYSTTHSMTLGDLLVGSRLALTGGADAGGGSLGIWGQGSRTSFDGAQDGINLDGDVTTALLGADYARGDWLVGVALTQSRGDGGYRSLARPGEAVASDAPIGDGAIETSLTAAIPYASWRASERLDLWGAVGHGAGEVTLEPESHDALSTDIGWTMAAGGLRSDLFASASGASLSLVSDALWARTTSDRISGLAATEGAVARLRLGLEGSRAFQLPGGGSLTSKLELGARHDGGDAETGFGVELGGGVAWAHPKLGLRIDIEGRRLISHEDGGFEDRGFSASFSYDPTPGSVRGLSLTLRQDIGAASSGGLDALFTNDPLGSRYGYGHGGGYEGGHGGAFSPVDTGRWSAEAAYGLSAFGGRFTGSPHLGYGASAFGRDLSVGWRLAPADGGPDLSLGVLLTRREAVAAPTDQGIGIEVRARW